MRKGFVHEASIELERDGDPQAPGAAVTVNLCGHWEHEGACRWPHQSKVGSRSGRRIGLRVVFVAEPADEHEVRSRIARAVRDGKLDGPTGVSYWTVLTEGPSELSREETTLAAELTSK